MSWTRVQSTSAAASPGGSVSATFGSSVTPGNVVIAWVGTLATGSGFALENLVDNHGNEYGLVVSESVVHVGTHGLSEIWYAVVGTGGSSYQVTYDSSWASADLFLVISEYSFSGSFSIDGTSQNNSSSGTTVDPGAITTTHSDLVVGMGVQVANSQTWTPNTGFSTVASQASSVATCAVDAINVAAGSPDPKMSGSVSGAWSAVGAAFSAVTTTSYTMPAATGQYLVGSVGAQLSAQYGIWTADPGLFVVDGFPITMARGKVLICATGVYAVTGHAASPAATYHIPADTVVYGVTGFAVTLNKFTNQFRLSQVTLEGNFKLSMAAAMKGTVSVPIMGVVLDTAAMNFTLPSPSSFATGFGISQVDIQYTESMPLAANTPTTIGLWGDSSRFDSLGQPLNLARIKLLVLANNNFASASLGGVIKFGCGSAADPVTSFWKAPGGSVLLPDGARFALWSFDATGYVVNSTSAFQLFLDPGAVSSSYTLFVLGCKE